MKIVALRPVPFVLPYRKPFHMASGEVAEAAHVLVQVDTDEGVTGVAEAVSRPMIYGESQESILAAVHRWFEPALLGQDPLRTEPVQHVLATVAGNETAKGALDLALHDIRGKAAGASTWQLLGGAERSLRVTRMLSMGEQTAVVEEAVAAAEGLGVSSFKVKIDNDVAASVRLLDALREQLGPEVVLYVDANQSLSLSNALTFLRETAPLGIAFVEEPVSSYDLTGRARVATGSPVPVMVDESARTAREAGRQLTAGSARAVSIKTARTGYTESARILGLAQGLHAHVVIGSQGDSALGAITSATFGAAFSATSREPAELDYFLGLRDQVVANPPVITGGLLHVDDAVAGNGAVLDRDKVEHYRTDR